MSDNDLITADKLIDKIDIPAQPELLIAINRESKKGQCDFDLVADMISNDIGIASEVLKTVNSPLFGLNQTITSIQQAVGLLGLLRIITLVRDVSLRQMVSDGLDLSQFWIAASKDAQICGLIATQSKIIDPEEAYTFGLFHNAGIPILMQNYPDYEEQIHGDSMLSGLEATKAEDNVYKVNHAIVGYYLCDKWFLPEHICKALFYHHRSHLVFKKTKKHDDPFVILLALLVTAQHITGAKEGAANEEEYPLHWKAMQPKLREIFQLDENGYNDLINKTKEQLLQVG
ncbi:MAG: HDOD domain-containing protein [Gammaproteobacteria bacterium]|nr:HDOD domain-containing protein [Gammaproteobacteria bacterium]